VDRSQTQRRPGDGKNLLGILLAAGATVAFFGINASARQERLSRFRIPAQFRRDSWSGRQDLNLRPPGPERALEEFHRIPSAGTPEQPSENTGEQEASTVDTVSLLPLVETPVGAPVVRELPPDPGPHERLLTVRQVATRLGVSSALVYKLCQRNLLRGLRIGGALRFQLQAISEYLSSIGG